MAVHTLTQTERDFIKRAVNDAHHILAVWNGNRFTESKVGEVVEEESSTLIDNRDCIDALDVALHLLGEAEVPRLEMQLGGLRAHLESKGDAKGLRLYDKWRESVRKRAGQ